MAIAPSPTDSPILTGPVVVPRYRRRRARTWRNRAYEIATDTARELAWAATICAIVEVVVLVAVGILVPHAGAALVVAAVIAVLVVTGTAVRKAATR